MAGKREEQLKEITERLEQGVQELFTSERYAEYLRTMSQFHTYSFNNTLLIAMQKPDATLVAGYQAWQKKFHRQVKRGEKGIQIISPAPIRRKEERDKVDEQTGQVILKPDGEPEKEEVVHVIPQFKVATVFDVSQTVGEPLPELGVEELTASVENYDAFLAALTQVSPVPIRFAEIEGEAKGFYSNENKEIVIQSGMSESQTLKTAIHEIAHARLHDREVMKEQGIEKDHMTREVEAESVAYTVCQQFGIDTSDYSFAYVASWSSSMEMKELRASMDTIRHTAAEFIDELTEQIQLQREQQEQYMEATEYQEVEIFEVPALYSNGRIADDDIPAGFYRYDLRGSDYDPGSPVTVQNTVVVNHVASILTMYPLNLPEQGFLYMGEGLNFIGGEISIQEFRQKMADMDIAALAENMQDAVVRANENLLWEDSGDRYAIYQIRDDAPGDSYRFMNMDFVNGHGIVVRGSDYALVYGGELGADDTLEGLYERFNINRPQNFTGHSLSVSDVVIISRGGEVSAHYVDSVGFQSLPDFVQERQEMWTQQLTMAPETIENEVDETLDNEVAVEQMADKETLDAETEVIEDQEEIQNDDSQPAETVESELPVTETPGSVSQDDTENRANVNEPTHQDTLKPLYLQSPAYAREHGELEQYRESRRISIACKDAIEKAVADNFDGMHLNSGAVKPVVDQFGEERVAYVLATTIQMKDWDRRFSPSNKEWAASVPIGEEISPFGNDRRLEWTVESHPAVLDGFVRMFQKEVQEQAHEMEQELTADEITNFKEISREYYPHMRTAEYVFSCEVRGEPDVLTYEVSQHDDGEGYSLHTKNHDIWERMSRKELEKLESVVSREVTLNQWLQEIEKADSPDALREVQYGLWESEHLNLTDEQIDVIYKRMDEKEKTFPMSALDDADHKKTAEVEEIAGASETEKVTEAEETAGEPEKVSVALYYVDSDVNGERTENSYRTFPNVDLALGAYAELPNHLDKEIGMESTETPPSRMALIRCKNGVDTLCDIEEESLSGKWVTQETLHAQIMAQYVLDNHDVEIAYYIEPSDHYLAIQTVSEGYDYTFYDGAFHQLDGGVYDDLDISINEAIEEILSGEKLSAWPRHRKVMDYSELMEKTSAVAREDIRKAEERAQKMMKEEKRAPSEEQKEEEIPLISDRTEPSQSLHGKSMADIEETVLCYAQAEIDSMGLQDEVKLLGARVYGSRSREGLYTDGSDLDVVLSYTGNIGEDAFFNALHESGLSIGGMPVDINPISTEKTGTLTEYLHKANQYLDEKAAQMAEQTQDASVKQEPVEPRITFYVAECMEFPILGEWHEEIPSLSEAVALYEKIPAERMNGIKGIGFTLYDGSVYDGMPQEMMSAGIVDRADVNEIQQFKESPLVQKAMDELEAVYPPERTEKNVVQAEVREASVHEERTDLEPEKTSQTIPEKMPQAVSAESGKESKDRGSAVAAGGRKESVLQALRDRKAKMKEQEKASGKEQDRKADRKKGEQSL
ncbi:MAG: DUF3849 domain-containing protein [Clostridiales bacterium]|nr:DUF3849 domain-containing protein [Clostridiales bacterium]